MFIKDLCFLLNGLAEPGPWQVVNRIQKLRKKIALEPTDVVDVYIESLDEDKTKLERVLKSQVLSLSVRVHMHILHVSLNMWSWESD